MAIKGALLASCDGVISDPSRDYYLQPIAFKNNYGNQREAIWMSVIV